MDPQFPGPAGSHGPSVPLPATPRPVPPSPPRILGSQVAGVILASVAASSPPPKQGPAPPGPQEPAGAARKDQHRRGSGRAVSGNVTVSRPARSRPAPRTGPRRLAPPRPAPAGGARPPSHLTRASPGPARAEQGPRRVPAEVGPLGCGGGGRAALQRGGGRRFRTDRRTVRTRGGWGRRGGAAPRGASRPPGAGARAGTPHAPARGRALAAASGPERGGRPGRWGSSRGAAPGAGAAGTAAAPPEPAPHPGRASGRAGGGRAGTPAMPPPPPPLRQRPSPPRGEVGEFRFVPPLCPSGVAGGEGSARGCLRPRSGRPRAGPAGAGRRLRGRGGGRLLDPGAGGRAAGRGGGAPGARFSERGRSRAGGRGGERRARRLRRVLGCPLEPWSRELVSGPRRAPLGCTCVCAPRLRPDPAPPGDAPLGRLCRAPCPPPEVVAADPAPPGRRGGGEGPDVRGLLCRPRARSARSGKGSGRTKAAGPAGRCAGGGRSPSRRGWAWGGERRPGWREERPRAAGQ